MLTLPEGDWMCEDLEQASVLVQRLATCRDSYGFFDAVPDPLDPAHTLFVYLAPDASGDASAGTGYLCKATAAGELPEEHRQTLPATKDKKPVKARLSRSALLLAVAFEGVVCGEQGVMFSVFSVSADGLARKMDFYRSAISYAETRDVLFDFNERYLLVNSSSGTIHVFEVEPKKAAGQPSSFIGSFVSSVFSSVKTAAVGNTSIFKFDKKLLHSKHDRLFVMDQGLLLLDHLSNYWKVDNLWIAIDAKLAKGKEAIQTSPNFFGLAADLLKDKEPVL